MLLVVLLTLLTQTGGAILLLAWVLWKVLKWDLAWVRLGTFVALYFVLNFTLTPYLAERYHKQPLPLRSEIIRPQNWFTVLTNRHYVHDKLYTTLMEVAEKYHQQFPERALLYLDAGFPLGERYPLLPHRAHFDGKAIDMAFAYSDTETETPLRRSPNFMGYGRYEGPRSGEPNWPQQCKDQQGSWWYSLPHVFALRPFNDVSLDAAATRWQLRTFAEHPSTTRIFLEPHLKQRWRLMRHDKVRFHGCKAMRHDDHYHLSVR